MGKFEEDIVFTWGRCGDQSIEPDLFSSLDHLSIKARINVWYNSIYLVWFNSISINDIYTRLTTNTEGLVHLPVQINVGDNNANQLVWNGWLPSFLSNIETDGDAYWDCEISSRKQFQIFTLQSGSCQFSPLFMIDNYDFFRFATEAPLVYATTFCAQLLCKSIK